MTLVADTLKNFKDRLAELEKQIQPLEAEAAELRTVIAKLEEHVPARRRSARATSRSRATAGGSRATGKGPRAKRGQTRETILQAALANPEATSGQIAEITGVARNTVATTMSKLRASGDLPKRR